MKILQVIDQLNIGGAERVVLDLSNILCEHNEDVTLLSIRGVGILNEYLDKRIKFIAMERQSKYSLTEMKRFVNIANNYDIIHVHMRHTMAYVAVALLLKPSMRKRVVFHDHYGDINIDKACPIPLRYSLRHCTAAYIGVSQQLVNWAKSWNVKNCMLLPNIVRKQMPNYKTNIASGYVSVGNIRTTKNYLHLIKIAKTLPNAHFTIYGNRNEPNYYENVVAEKGDNVDIIEGVSNVQPLLPNYKVAIHSAPSETGPLVLIEYMAQGIPFITYDTGEVVEQVKEELPELILDTFDVAVWVERLQYIEIHYEVLKSKLSEVYEKYYSEYKYYQSCKQIYKNVLNS